MRPSRTRLLLANCKSNSQPPPNPEKKPRIKKAGVLGDDAPSTPLKSALVHQWSALAAIVPVALHKRPAASSRGSCASSFRAISGIAVGQLWA